MPDLSIFSLSKIFWAVVAPGNALIILLAVGILLRHLAQPQLQRFGKILTVTAGIIFVTIAVIPIGHWALAGHETKIEQPDKLPDQVDGIIVLGGALDPYISEFRDQITLNSDAERLIAFAELVERYPDAQAVYTGGSGWPGHQYLREADYAREFYNTLGVKTDEIIFERESRNTRENAVYSKKRVDPQPNEAWILITSAYHMPRAAGVFEKVNWPVIPYPVDYRVPKQILDQSLYFDLSDNLENLEEWSHEVIGILAYRLFGWI